MSLADRPLPSTSAAFARLTALAPLDDDDRRLLAAALARTRVVRPRRELATEGTPVAGPLVLVDGWAARVRLLADGRRQFLAFLLPGDVVGLHHQRAPLAAATTVTLTQVTVATAPHAPPATPLGHLFAVDGALAEAYLLAQVTRLGRLSAQERISDLLLEFHERLAPAGLVHHGRFEVPLTQEMIADALGLTSVHVNRMLQQARRDGDVLWERGRVTLPDPAALATKLGRHPPRVTAAGC